MNGVSISRNPCSYSTCAHGERDLRAQNDIALHVRTAQIDVAILQARVFLDVDVVFHRKRRRARFVQNPELLDHHFDFAGRNGRIDGFRRAQLRPRPSTAITYSERSSSAFCVHGRDRRRRGRPACVTPSRSRRWMKITPPRSRRRCTQPIRSARLPASEARSSPQVCVRRRSPRKSRGTVCSIVYLICSSSSSRRAGTCSPDRHVLQRICPGGDLVVAHDQRDSARPSCWRPPARASACGPPTARRETPSRAQVRAPAAPACCSAASPSGARNTITTL